VTDIGYDTLVKKPHQPHVVVVPRAQLRSGIHWCKTNLEDDDNRHYRYWLWDFCEQEKCTPNGDGLPFYFKHLEDAAWFALALNLNANR
jgi:hypothetical protein